MPCTSWFEAKTLGCECKIAIPISPKVIFVTFGENKFLFGVIEITFGEMLVLLLLNHDPELCFILT